MLIYHYCTMDTFVSIIKNQTIRLSDITKSNDSMELLWVEKYIREIFNEEFDKDEGLSHDYKKEMYLELLNRYINEFFDERNRYYTPFVCCFSHAKDRLSQWRGYADDGKGVAIGFDVENLSKLGMPKEDDNISSKIFCFNEVTYNPGRQENIVRRVAKSLMCDLKIIQKDSYKEVKSESLPMFNRHFLELFEHAIFMKSPFFREEKEVRICYFTNIAQSNRHTKVKIDEGVSMTDIEYRMAKNTVIPYIDLRFSGKRNDFIKTVLLGPKCNANERDIINFLRLNGFECLVEKSNGSYR